MFTDRRVCHEFEKTQEAVVRWSGSKNEVPCLIVCDYF